MFSISFDFTLHFFSRAVLHDATIHNQDIVELRDKIESLPEHNAQVEQQLAAITAQHGKILNRAQVCWLIAFTVQVDFSTDN